MGSITRNKVELEMDELEQPKQAGKFKISTDKEIYGELTFAGRDTSLYLTDDEFFYHGFIPNRCIKGTLYDLTQVTLVECISEGGGGRVVGNGGFLYENIFPHFVILGGCQIDPDVKMITEVDFVVDDASTLFHDSAVFGRLLDASPFIEEIVRAKYSQIGLECKIPIGPHPEILYFTGKHEIFNADTLLGKISASYRPKVISDGPGDVQLKNAIFVSIVFAEAINFEKCIDSTLKTLQYLGILVGRPQNLLSHRIGIQSERERPIFLDVYWSMPPKRDFSGDGRRPHHMDILLDAVRQPTIFSQVLENWIIRDQDWQDARQRFFNSFSQQSSYPIDRLIGAANMFDILPSSAAPFDVELSSKLKSAKEICRYIFKKLPNSSERNSILNALGRMGKSTLKHKIRHRAEFLLNAAGEKFPELVTVTDEAVNCRNHYVHGSESSFDYNKEFYAVIFFTETLEFIFAVSDLIETGWDFNAWMNSYTTMSHPFSKYRERYADNLQILQSLL
jgi:hypothetical protein